MAVLTNGINVNDTKYIVITLVILLVIDAMLIIRHAKEDAENTVWDDDEYEDFDDDDPWEVWE